MKKLLLLIVTCISVCVQAQVIEKCLSHRAIEYQESLTPGYAAHVNQVFENAKAYSAAHQGEKSNELYTIPVVVHIVHNTSAQNLPDSVIEDQIRILNEDYGRMNPDTINMRSDFDIVAGNPRIRFKLAQIDENGLPTSGITRTLTGNTTFGSLAAGLGDFSDLENVKSTANGGHDPWDPTRYLNIWVCNMSIFFLGQEITALLGYATPPDGLPHWPPGSTAGLVDGVVLQYQTVGSNNPNTLDMGNGPVQMLGRTASHEVGHYLGLRHIWGDGDCTAQDGVDDTPNADAQSNFDCNAAKNTCVDNIFGVDLPDMIENYMDYSAEDCQNSFTQGQVDIMHGVLENERYDLVYGNEASIHALDVAEFTLFPNPTNDIVTFKHNGQLTGLSLYSMYGEIINSSINTESGTSISINALPAGIYYVRYETAQGQIGSKRIVKR